MKMWKSEKVLAVLLFAIAFMGACRGSENVNSNANADAIRPMRIVTDDLDRRVTIPTKVTRVVSLAPNLTESIFAVGAGDRLVGVTTFCNYPEQAKAVAKIGDTMNPNMESIVALKPDIVFVSTASQIENFTRTLEANGIAVYVTNPRNLEEVFTNLTKLGELFETEGKTANLVTDLQRRVKAVEASEKYESDLRVFVQISREPLFSIGRDSFLTQLLVTAGAKSATDEIPTDYPKLSLEAAAEMNPDVIILSDSDDNLEPNAVFKNSKAVRSKRVYRINADLLSRPGPRLVDALEELGRMLHTHRS